MKIKRRTDGPFDVGETCCECGEPTTFGSGRFVNRLPAMIDIETNTGELVTVDGYLCPDCQLMECDRCGEQSPDFGGGPDGGIWCDDCISTVPDCPNCGEDDPWSGWIQLDAEGRWHCGHCEESWGEGEVQE